MVCASDNVLIINSYFPDAQAVRPFYWKFFNILLRGDGGCGW